MHPCEVNFKLTFCVTQSLIIMSKLFRLLQVLGELMGDKSLEKFRVEYEKLHRALKKSHESEKRLMQKCRELNAEIVANASKVQTALKLSQEDQTTIASLKKVTIIEVVKTERDEIERSKCSLPFAAYSW